MCHGSQQARRENDAALVPGALWISAHAPAFRSPFRAVPRSVSHALPRPAVEHETQHAHGEMAPRWLLGVLWMRANPRGIPLAARQPIRTAFRSPLVSQCARPIHRRSAFQQTRLDCGAPVVSGRPLNLRRALARPCLREGIARHCARSSERAPARASQPSRQAWTRGGHWARLGRSRRASMRECSTGSGCTCPTHARFSSRARTRGAPRA